MTAIKKYNHLIDHDSYFLTVGTATGITELSAFDEALRAAQVGDLNLVRMSSILPPNMIETAPCDIEDKGALVPLAYGSATANTNQVACVVSAGIAVALPKDKSLPGVIMEFHHIDEIDQSRVHFENSIKNFREKDALKIVMNMAEDALNRRGWELEKVLGKSISLLTHHGQPAAAFAGLVMYKGK